MTAVFASPVRLVAEDEGNPWDVVEEEERVDPVVTDAAQDAEDAPEEGVDEEVDEDEYEIPADAVGGGSAIPSVVQGVSTTEVSVAQAFEGREVNSSVLKGASFKVLQPPRASVDDRVHIEGTFVVTAVAHVVENDQIVRQVTVKPVDVDVTPFEEGADDGVLRAL